jgi:predicted AlkP superfamily pyrophosphatase or phosphodiesterase
VGYVVVIVLDGARPGYFDLAELPNLRGLMNNGTVYSDAWVGALENNTAPGHVSLSTGTFPSRHGILASNWLSPAAIFPSDPTSLEAVNRGDMPRIVQESGVPTLAGLVKARYPDGIVASVSSSKAYAAMALGMGPCDYVLYGRVDRGTITPASVENYPVPGVVTDDPRLTVQITAPGEENLFAARAGVVLVEKVRPRALLLNFAATDIFGHSSGGKIAPSTMRKVMEASDRAIGELIAAYIQAGIFDRPSGWSPPTTV